MKISSSLQDFIKKAQQANKTGIPPQKTKIDSIKVKKDSEKIKLLKDYFFR